MRDTTRSRPAGRGAARRRRYGQHFLAPEWAAKVVDVIDPDPADRFVEIGAGRGALTWALAERGARVLAIEIDARLAEGLRAAAPPGVEVLTRDVLDCDLAALARTLALPPGGAGRVRLVGNLPYRVSAPILLHVLRAHDGGAPLSDAVVMLQREVADRLTAEPGAPAWGPLAVAASLRAAAARRLRLPPGAFQPPPAVHSAVVALRFRPPAEAPGDRGLFEALVRAIFTQRRKQAGSALDAFAARYGLSGAEACRRAGLDARRRPGDLALADLVRLADVLRAAAL